MAIFRREPLNRGVECRWGRQKSRFWANIWLHRVMRAVTARCYQHGSAGPWQVVTLTASSKRRSLLMAGDDEMFTRRSLNVTPKTTEQHLSVRSDKSVAYVTDNKRLRSTFCTIEANYWHIRSIARPLCDSRATCLFYSSTFVVSINACSNYCRLWFVVLHIFTYLKIEKVEKLRPLFRLICYDFWDTFGTFYFERICQLYCHKFRKIKWRHIRTKPLKRTNDWLFPEL